MKTRFNKILTVITAVTFVAALTINIQASLSDPFAGMSDEAVVLTTTGDETSLVDPWACPNGCLMPAGMCYCYGWQNHEENI